MIEMNIEVDAQRQELAKEKARIRSARWAAKNKDKVNATQRAYRANNPEKFKARIASWRERNAEKDNATRAAYKRTLAGKVSSATYSHKRRARKLNSGGSVTKQQLIDLRAQQPRCFYCNKKSKRLTYDHIQLLSRGGVHSIENLVMACRSCNCKKNNKDPLHFATQSGLLFI